MIKEGLLVPCPFFAGKYCSEGCSNFYNVLVATAEEASNRDASFVQVVEEIVNASNAEVSSRRMTLKHLEASSQCDNNMKH
ncbi:MAG: hypothetical protein QY322_04555 [bacterium]|nr:MAG: hypothetical protein QY322_04555 [bacterium]